MLAQIFANTVFTFANLLAVYLVGTSLGSWLYARHAVAAHGARQVPVAAGLLLAHAAATVVAAWSLRFAPETLSVLLADRRGYAVHALAELGVAFTVFLVPTLLMGALFAHLVGWAAPKGVGKAYAVNTLGAALAPPVVSLWWMAELDYAGVLRTHAVLYLVGFGALAVVWRLGRRWLIPAVGTVAAVTVALPSNLGLIRVPFSWETISHSEGPYGTILVTQHRSSGDRRLQVNQRYRMGGTRDLVAKRLGQIPLLLASDAKRALFLGIGTGATLAAVRSFPALQTDAVELVPEIVAFMPLFAPINDRVYQDSRVRIYTADARRFLAASRKHYDVIVADLFHPARDGAAALFSREHFRLARAHLTERGLFAQLVPTHQIDVPELRLLVRTFLDVFPVAYSFLGIYNAKTPIVILVGTRNDSLRVDLARLQSQLERPEYASLELSDPRDLFGAALLDPEALRRLGGTGPAQHGPSPASAL